MLGEHPSGCVGARPDRAAHGERGPVSGRPRALSSGRIVPASGPAVHTNGRSFPLRRRAFDVTPSLVQAVHGGRVRARSRHAMGPRKSARRKAPGKGEVMESTTKTAACTWRGRFRDPDGRELQRTFKRRDDAKAWVRAHETRLDSGEFLDPRRAKKRFGDFWAEFLDGSDIRPTTRARYEGHYARYLAPTFADRALGSITPEDCRKWRSGLARAGTGAATVFSVTTLLGRRISSTAPSPTSSSTTARHVPNPSVVRPTAVSASSNRRSSRGSPRRTRAVPGARLVARDARVGWRGGGAPRRRHRYMRAN